MGGKKTFLQDFSALGCRPGLPTAGIRSSGETAMAFSFLSENEFTEDENNPKKGASVRNLSAALLPRVLRWLTYYFVERALLVMPRR